MAYLWAHQGQEPTWLQFWDVKTEVALCRMLGSWALYAQVSKPDALARARLGLAAAQKSQYGEASGALDKESARAPGKPVTTLLAMSYYGLGQFKEAAERLQPGGGEAGQ